MKSEKEFYESRRDEHVNMIDLNSLYPITEIECAISLSNKQKEDIKKCLKW